MKLKDWADKTGVKYLTAYRWFKNGSLPVAAYQTSSGTIIVEDEAVDVKQPDNSNPDAMSVFLKKTIEFSKNESSVEDFAAYVLSNFQLKLIGQDAPKYSRNKPKSEEVQKHFKKFIPSNVEKPAPCAFIPEPEVWESITDNTEGFVGTNEVVKTTQGLVNEIRKNDEGALVSSSVDNVSLSTLDVKDLQASLSGMVNTSSNGLYCSTNSIFDSDLTATGATLTFSDVNPQNYTYSTNSGSSSLLGSALGESPVFVNLYNALHTPGPDLTEKPKRGRPRKNSK